MLDKINGEPVKLAKSFDDLKESMLVYDCCSHCGGKYHRLLLLNKRFYPRLVHISGIECSAVAFQTYPSCTGHSALAAISPRYVKENKVYIVIDPILEKEQEKKLEKIK